MVAATGGNIVTLEVCGPMGEKVNAFYGLTGDGKTAVIEMAAASGLMLVAPEKRNPLLASSFGTGELIRHALDNGIRHIILGIGGSATVDGGMGMAQALGVRFLDADGQVGTLGSQMIKHRFGAQVITFLQSSFQHFLEWSSDGIKRNYTVGRYRTIGIRA